MRTQRLTCPALAAAVVLGTGLPAAQAHDLWVNAMSDSGDGPVTAVVTSVGRGHMPLPLAEFLPGDRIGACRVIDPTGVAVALPLDPAANAGVHHLLDGLDGVSLQTGDALVRRLVLGDGAPQCGWRVHLANPPAPRTTWVDARGLRRAGPVLPDEIEGAQQIVASAVSVRDATAWWTHGARSAPAPSGVALELLPAADPAALVAGDTLEVRLHWNGQPPEAGAMALFTAFGAHGAEAAIAEHGPGRAGFTLPEAGPWLLRAMIDVPVAEAGPDVAGFEGRSGAIRCITTLTVTVRP